MSDELMSRPTARDAYVLQRMTELCMPRVKSYFYAWDFNEKEIAEGLKKVVTPHGDGYELAKDMERCGWEGSKALIELMEECSSLFCEALEELTWQWVRCLNIKPQFKIGDQVQLPKNYGQSTGEIVGFNEKQAKYHVRTSDQKPTSYWVIEFERISELKLLGDGFLAAGASLVTQQVNV